MPIITTNTVAEHGGQFRPSTESVETRISSPLPVSHPLQGLTSRTEPLSSELPTLRVSVSSDSSTLVDLPSQEEYLPSEEHYEASKVWASTSIIFCVAGGIGCIAAPFLEKGGAFPTVTVASSAGLLALSALAAGMSFRDYLKYQAASQTAQSLNAMELGNIAA